VVNPDQADADGDTVGDACDPCPERAFPSRDPDDCIARVIDLVISSQHPAGLLPKVLTWRTTNEEHVLGFNAVAIDARGGRVRLNDVLIPCEECVEGTGRSYTLPLPKLRGSQEVFLEVLLFGGAYLQTYGPAVKE
jgi:hypothetical protein